MVYAQGDARKDAEAWSDAATVELVDEALVVVSQAYDQDGNALITEGNASFARYPGVRLLVRAGSDIWGDHNSRIVDELEVLSEYVGA